MGISNFSIRDDNRLKLDEIIRVLVYLGRLYTSMPISYITYKGKDILYIDLRESKTEQRSKELLAETVKAYQESSGDIIALTNVEGAYMNPEIIEETKKYAKSLFTQRAKKRAMVGVKGLKKLIFNSYAKISGNNIRLFDTEEEAKEFLIAD